MGDSTHQYSRKRVKQAQNEEREKNRHSSIYPTKRIKQWEKQRQRPPLMMTDDGRMENHIPSLLEWQRENYSLTQTVQRSTKKRKNTTTCRFQLNTPLTQNIPYYLAYYLSFVEQFCPTCFPCTRLSFSSTLFQRAPTVRTKIFASSFIVFCSFLYYFCRCLSSLLFLINYNTQCCLFLLLVK